MPTATTRLGAILMMITAMTASAQRLVAHRGASHDAPENTIAAFSLAWEQGADGVEGDFHLTADGRIVCIHDADTDRVAGAKHVVCDSTFAELRALDVGAWKDSKYRGERIPSFEEVLATVPKGKLFVVELKAGPEIVPPLAEALADRRDAGEQIVVISFNERTVAECARRLPRLRRHWLTSFKRDDRGLWNPSIDQVSATIKRTRSTGLGGQAIQDALGEAELESLAGAGVREFHVWTVDDPAVARFYLDRGAEWITTNRPRWLRDQLAGGE